MIFFIIKLFVTVSLLSITFYNIDFKSLSNVFSKIEIKLLFIALLIQFSLSIIQTLRWMKISNVFMLKLSFIESWKNVLIGLFFNQTLPSSVGGDAVRVLILSNFGYALPFKTIIIDRFFGLFACCFICVIGGLIIEKRIIEEVFLFETIFVFPLLCMLTSISVIFLGEYLRKIKIIKLILNKFGILNFLNSLKILIFDYKVTFFAFIYSTTIHVMTAFSAFLILQSLQIHTIFFDFAILFLTVLLISTIPISIGGWGLRENLMILIMSNIGLQTEIALAISIIFGFIMILIGLPGSMIWISNKFEFKVPFRDSND